MTKAKTRITLLPHAEGLPYPSERPDSLDLLAAVGPPFGPVVIRPGERAAIPTGLMMELPANSVGQIRPRTGLAFRHGVSALNCLVDNDYRGEVQVVLTNFGERPYIVERGTPIARFVIAPRTPLDCEWPLPAFLDASEPVDAGA